MFRLFSSWFKLGLLTSWLLNCERQWAYTARQFLLFVFFFCCILFFVCFALFCCYFAVIFSQGAKLVKQSSESESRDGLSRPVWILVFTLAPDFSYKNRMRSCDQRNKNCFAITKRVTWLRTQTRNGLGIVFVYASIMLACRTWW